MSHSPLLNEWEMRSRVQTINRDAEQMLLMRQAGGTDEQATTSLIGALRARLQRVGISATSASSRAARGALREINTWLGFPWVLPEEQAEA